MLVQVDDGQANFRDEQSGEVVEVEVGELVRADLIR
jgi:hypothetical protein